MVFPRIVTIYPKRVLLSIEITTAIAARPETTVFWLPRTWWPAVTLLMAFWRVEASSVAL